MGLTTAQAEPALQKHCGCVLLSWAPQNPIRPLPDALDSFDGLVACQNSCSAFVGHVPRVLNVSPVILAAICSSGIGPKCEARLMHGRLPVASALQVGAEAVGRQL